MAWSGANIQAAAALAPRSATCYDSTATLVACDLRGELVEPISVSRSIAILAPAALWGSASVEERFHGAGIAPLTADGHAPSSVSNIRVSPQCGLRVGDAIATGCDLTGTRTSAGTPNAAPHRS